MKQFTLMVILALTLCACSLESPRGSGPIIISEAVEQGFKKYKELQSPTYFAVSQNGQRYGYSYCDDYKCRKGGQHIALQYCKQPSTSSVPCKIFAREREIVWDGPVHFRSSGKPDPEIFGDKPFFFGPVFD